jgi:hypothetical protein
MSNTRCEGSNKVGSCKRQAPESLVIWRLIPMRATHHAMRSGAMRLAARKATEVPLMLISRRPLTNACQMPCAITSG